MRDFALPTLDFDHSPLTFATTAEGAIVTGCRPDATDIDVPALHAGLPVVRIGSEAFLNHMSLLRITLPDTVRTIGDAAFMGCHALMRVRAGSGLEVVQPYAFYECVSLRHVDFPSRPVSSPTTFAACYQLGAANEPLPLHD